MSMSGALWREFVVLVFPLFGFSIVMEARFRMKNCGDTTCSNLYDRWIERREKREDRIDITCESRSRHPDSSL